MGIADPENLTEPRRTRSSAKAPLVEARVRIDYELQPWLSMDTIATLLEVSKETLRKWQARGEFPPFSKTPGGEIRVRHDHFLEWVESWPEIRRGA